MSGFAGFVNVEGAPPDQRLLEQIAAQLAFRGPDGTHIWTQPGAAFCFTFFRTRPAPQCPKQPCSLDGRVWLLGDVRLDGRDDLRRQLEAAGEPLSAEVTDEELVLRQWHRCGEAGLPDLLGDFSFVLWDAEARELVGVRDLMGARPFFYADLRGWLYFSNTLNALRRSPHVSRELDRHYIGDFLLEGWCPDLARTAFRDISRLPPGHVLRYSSSGLEVRRYTTLPIEEPLWLKREEEYVERFRELLEQAVLDRLPHGPAAILMSGGLDSTSIAAVAVDNARKRGLPLDLRAFTVDYQPLFDDQEGRLANLAAQHMGISIEIHSGASCRPYQGWDDPRRHMPEPLHEPFRSIYWEEIRRIAGSSRIVVTGYGGDGIMTGQCWPFLVYLARHVQLGIMARAFGGYALKHGRVPPLRGGFRSRFRKWLGQSEPPEKYPQWLAPEFESELRLRDRWKELHSPREASVSLHPLYPNAYRTLNEGLWAIVLEGEDAAWSGVPVQSHAPLLDWRILEFLLRVPPMPLCVNKQLLRRTVEGLLPDEVRLREKTPFQGDVLAHQIGSRLWSPIPIPPATQTAKVFLDLDKLSEDLQNCLALSRPPDLRPISLLHWLTNIENGQGIQ